MFKLISCLVAGSIVLAPLLPAQAGYENRSSGFGVSISSPSGFGSFGRQPYGDGSGYGRNRVILRSTVGNRVGNPYNSSPYNSSPYSTYPYGAYSPGIYSPGFRRSTVIVAPN
ncbi:MAG TPA: hypothetical protein VL134_11370, partial [Leptolyngbya sp.]|nr:hypothetical protein [Leptolyngbya sp.]